MVSLLYPISADKINSTNQKGDFILPMKTMKILISILMTMLIVSLTACGNDNGTDNKTSPAENPANDRAEIFEYEGEPQWDVENSESEQESTYYHMAICGAVVIEQDGTPQFTYVTKCENCGQVQSGNSLANATGGVLHGSFFCSGCKETQQFEIKTTQS